MFNLKHKIIETIQCGKHSGIPSCCIAFYCTIWSSVIIKDEKLWSLYWNIIHSFEEYHIKNCDKIKHEEGNAFPIYWEYIPCPKCMLSGYKIDIKSCSC